MEFAGKNSLVLDIGAGLSLAAAAVAHVTDSTFSATLGQLARLSYKTAICRANLNADGAATVTVRVKAGASELGSAQQVLAAGDNYVKFDVDLSGVEGSAALVTEVEVNITGAGTTASIYSVLDVETPLVIGSC